MTLQEIRQQFFDFFEQKGHLIVPSAPMVIKNDPTLMFTNAGMNQFKDYFLGNEIPKNRRIADSQKCLRVSGKHNDLEEVGVDTYHHTMFEMLGNWSFGDYFKKEAIEWAWELLTEVYKIPQDQLYVTVFEGDEKDGVPADLESFEIWKKFIAEDRIILANKKDNFWEMGDTGPCGPCTEIHVDIRPISDREKISGRSLVNMDHPQVIEIWNNVFIQFNRKANGSLEKLPETHVDTGMGLERLAMVLQGKISNYDTDLFQQLIQHIEGVSGFEYGKTEEVDIALRVIADHVRAIAFSIADGQLPSNTGAGYVIRRILRRAVRYGYSTLNLKTSFLSDLSVVLGEAMGGTYTELITQKEIIRKVIFEEEQSFFRTLEQGIGRIAALIETTKKEGQTELNGAAVFELYDTFGFPVDLTSLIARENNLTLDEKGFDVELEKQKTRSRSATAIETDDWVNILPNETPEFIGYDTLTSEAKIIRYRKVTQKQKTLYQLVLTTTPFYAESGGQVGDKGYLEANGEKIYILDTKKENGLIIHFTEKLPSDPSVTFTAVVDETKRRLTTSNHTATHLLHHALRTVLGTHVEQKGSLVNENYLRFDFSHFSKVTAEELEKVEELVNAEIHKAVPLNEIRYTTMETAKEMGAMALFGEKYGDKVRVIQFGDSVELCGGTHVVNTSDIRTFKFKLETAVAAGIRRVEAITNITAEKELNDKATLLDEIALIFKNPKDLKKSIEDVLVKNHDLLKEVEKLQKEKAMTIKNELKSKIVATNGVHLLMETLDLDANSIKDILYALKSETTGFVGLIGGVEGDKCSLSLIIDETVVSEKDLNAGTIIREIAKFIQGGGGGQAFFATAGGKNPAGIAEALKAFKGMLG